MAGTAAPKQTLDHRPALLALGEVIHLLPHHTKPYRRRHVVMLVVAIAFLAVMLLEIATVVTRQSLDPRNLFSNSATPAQVVPSTAVKSSNGFAFAFNPEQFTATALIAGQNAGLTSTELKGNKSIDSITLKPLPSRVPAVEAATEFELAVERDAAAFATFKSLAPPRTDIARILADYFAPKATNLANIAEVARTTESIGGTLMTKAIYTVTPKFGGKTTHSIVWTAEIKGKPLAMTVRGIIDGTNTPSSIAPIIQSVKLDSEAKVQGIADVFKADPVPVIDQKYVTDLVSPAVVKVYHLVCGSVVYKGQVISEDICSGVSGSGFMVSSDGYVATNGHVVVYGAKDMMVGALLEDQILLEQFLLREQLTRAQIREVMSRADLTASAVSAIYDLSDTELRLANQRQVTAVTVGTTPLDITTPEAAKKLVTDFKPDDQIKQATVIGYDYAAKDQLALVADSEKGFSASDVGLLKISATDAPMVSLRTNQVTQGAKITLFGYPNDADNQLIDTSKIDVTVTYGSINAVRDAAGGKSKLYQSDADASHGSSGGPAVDDEGKAFGLLTYRYASGESGDAAKSYIRDISDFTNLVKSKNVTLNTNSATQSAWQNGLDLYARHNYSEAQKEFERVQSLYPTHRLASTYIELSKQAVKDGKDVKDPSVLLLVAGAGASLAGLLLAVILIARHHGHHKVYRAYHSHKLSVHHGAS